jgi:hypothetical protein
MIVATAVPTELILAGQMGCWYASRRTTSRSSQALGLVAEMGRSMLLPYEDAEN